MIIAFNYGRTVSDTQFLDTKLDLNEKIAAGLIDHVQFHSHCLSSEFSKGRARKPKWRSQKTKSELRSQESAYVGRGCRVELSTLLRL